MRDAIVLLGLITLLAAAGAWPNYDPRTVRDTQVAAAPHGPGMMSPQAPVLTNYWTPPP